MRNMVSVGKIQEEWPMNSRRGKSSKQASKQASLRAIITEGRGSQIKSPLIREAFKGKLVGL